MGDGNEEHAIYKDGQLYTHVNAALPKGEEYYMSNMDISKIEGLNTWCYKKAGKVVWWEHRTAGKVVWWEQQTNSEGLDCLKNAAGEVIWQQAPSEGGKQVWHSASGRKISKHPIYAPPPAAPPAWVRNAMPKMTRMDDEEDWSDGQKNGIYKILDDGKYEWCNEKTDEYYTEYKEPTMSTSRRLAEDVVQTHEILAAGALCILSFTV